MRNAWRIRDAKRKAEARQVWGSPALYPRGVECPHKLRIPKPMIDKELLEILVCPETGKPLEEAGREIVVRLNELVELGTLVDRSGERVSEKIEEGLICRDGKHLYPVRENIPILLIENSIPLP